MPLLFCVSAQLGIDNSILEFPEVECQSHEVMVKFHTKNPFQGHVFVQGHYDSPDCHKDYVSNGEKSGFIQVAFEKCGMRRKRSANPRGMSMSATVIISFHRTFITHVDRAYFVDCFYIEEEKVVTFQLAVSDPPTAQLSIDVPPMPVCTYQVLADGPNGSLVTFARVGDKVYHKWSCSYPFPEMYCMVIHSCTVDDGESHIFEAIDDTGCAKDPVIIEELSYISDLMVGTEASVFKFADRPRVYFTCQVRLSLKNEQKNRLCPKPECGVTAVVNKNEVRKLRLRRDIVKLSKKSNDFDLVAPPMIILDVEDSVSSSPTNSGEPISNEVSEKEYLSNKKFPLIPSFFSSSDSSPGICLSSTSFGVLIAAALISTLTAVLFAAVYVIRNGIVKRRITIE